MKNHPNAKHLQNLPKGVPLRQIAVMNVEKGEEVLGAYVTPHIQQIGIYKLLAKKKKDGMCEWAHFVQRDDGRKENVYRGAVENEAGLAKCCVEQGVWRIRQPASRRLGHVHAGRESNPSNETMKNRTILP